MTWHDGRVTTAASFVAAARSLLDAAVDAAGGGEETLADFVAGLTACLSTTGPYATLRVDAGLVDQDVRGELTANIEAVSALVLDLVRDAPPGRPGPADIHSSCVGYSWIPPVVRRLIGGPETAPSTQPVQRVALAAGAVAGRVDPVHERGRGAGARRAGRADPVAERA